MHEGPEGFVLLELEDGVVLRGVGESLAGESVGFALEGLLEVEFGDLAASLPMHHKDPFDRMLVAQAMVEGMVLVNADKRAWDSIR